MEERLCKCGDPEDAHVDGEGMCSQCKCMFFDPVCEFCGGTGEVVVDEAVYPGEPHMAPIGTRPCICQIKEDDGDGPDD